MRVRDLAAALGATTRGDAEREVVRVANLKSAGPDEISFLTDPRYRADLERSAAGAVILREADLAHYAGTALVMRDPYVGFAKAAQLLDRTPPLAVGIDPTAVVAPDAQLGRDVALGALAYVGPGAVLGDGVQLGAGASVGAGSRVGPGTRLGPHVTVCHDCVLGAGCAVQAGAVIGSDGFGYANERGTWLKIPQTGRVVIGDHVEIGAATCIDRGAIDDTVIESNVIIDNLCQIAHNVRIGTGTAIAGGTVFAGSVTVGRYCVIGGTSVFNGHISICDRAVISGMCMVMRSVTEPGVYSSGIPAQPNREWRLTAARTLHINEMYRKLTELEREVKRLQAAGADSGKGSGS